MCEPKKSEGTGISLVDFIWNDPIAKVLKLSAASRIRTQGPSAASPAL